jgi:hypothetical protein
LIVIASCGRCFWVTWRRRLYLFGIALSEEGGRFWSTAGRYLENRLRSVMRFPAVYSALSRTLHVNEFTSVRETSSRIFWKRDAPVYSVCRITE